jgi:hypothetical protein
MKKYDKHIQLSKNLANEDLVNEFFVENGEVVNNELGRQILSKLDTTLNDNLELINRIHRLETAAVQTNYMMKLQEDPSRIKWVLLRNKYLYAAAPFIKLRQVQKELRIYVAPMNTLKFNDDGTPLGINMEKVLYKLIDSMKVEILYTLQNSLED